MKKQRLIVVCGPTATGKSDFAVDLALQLNGEVISTDSRQVYRGLDKGSGKITKEEMKGIPHHGLDIVELTETPYTVAEFKDYAQKIIQEIIARGNTPILCGGTGMYIDAVICDTIFPAVEPNHILRKELETKSVEDLSSRLEKLDPARYALIDKKNKVRLIRAIEIATTLGSVPSLKQTQQYDVVWHYLDLPDDVLKKRIHDRLKKRFDEGMVDEVVRLSAHGISWERLDALGLEYRYISRYLRQMISYEEMVDTLEKASWQYVKRQRTWFKKHTQ